MPAEKQRCPWALASPEMTVYHDQEWGVPLHDERRLFEFLILEGAQAGLSWSTVLKRRPAYARAFADWDPDKVAAFGPAEVERLLAEPGIIRNRLKINSAIKNARAFLEVSGQFGGFGEYVWRFVDGRPVQNRWSRPGQVPAQTPRSIAMSKDLKARGFSFVGPTICYAFMQAVGMVNDHLTGCFRHAQCNAPAGGGRGA